MANLELLEQLMRNHTSISIAQDGVEEYFDQIARLIEEEKISQATESIEKVLSKGIADIRVIIYYVYAHFALHGINSLSAIFPLIKSLLSDYLDMLSPSNRRDKHAHNSLNWFFTQILKDIKYFEKMHISGKGHPSWIKTLSETSSKEWNHLFMTSMEFKDFFTSKWPQSPAKDRIMHLIKIIDDLKPLIAKNVQEEKENHAIEETINQHTDLHSPGMTIDDYPSQQPDQDSKHIIEQKKPPKADSETLPFPPSESAESVHSESCLSAREIPQGVPQLLLEGVSREDITQFVNKLSDINRKIEVFELLIKENNHLKAAVVARELDQVMMAFDALNYFPKLMTRYIALFAKHVDQLAEGYQDLDSLQFKTLEKLFRTDLDMFVKW